MKKKYTGIKARFIYLSVLLITGICIAMLGTAWARYQKSMSQDLDFVVRKPGTFQILNTDGRNSTPDNWIQNEDGSITYSFLVTNQEHSQDLNYYLRLATTVALCTEDVTVSLITENANGKDVTYAGVGEALKEDSVLYQQMGAGNLYRFYDKNGQEIIWMLEGSKDASQVYTIKVQGICEPALIELVLAETRQGE